MSLQGVKRPGRGFNHPPTSRAEVKERVKLNLYYSSGLLWLDTVLQDKHFNNNNNNNNNKFIIIIIIIIIIINCNWVITWWQWLFHKYTNMEKK